MSSQNENWQVMVEGQVYDADTETLKQWASEGRLLPTDKVKKGNLSWNDANRVPMLRAIFSGQTPPSTPVESTEVKNSYPQNQANNSQYPQYGGQSTSQNNFAGSPMPVFNPAVASSMGQAATGATVCRNHPQEYARFVCRMCNAAFCQACPKFMGSMAICTACGDMCNKIEELSQKASVVAEKVSYYGQEKDFGMNEFMQAIKYPLNHTIPFVFGTLVYGFFVLGTNIGGGRLAYIMATVFLFGCMSLTIRQVAMGRISSSFLPDFSSFSKYDDVIKPMLLSIAVSLITFAPIIVLVVALIASGKFSLFGPAMPAYTPQQNLSQEDIQSLVKGDNPDKDLEVAKKIQKLEPTRDIGVKSLEREERKAEQERAKKRSFSEQFTDNDLSRILAVGMVAVLVVSIGLLWAFFYYPMAIAIAGFTQDFWSVLNPMVGIDTMKRMGMVYVKAFFMYAGVIIASGIMQIGLLIVMSPIIIIPYLGMAIYQTVTGMLTFYVSLVISCILGLSLYKCADELDIAVDK